MKAKKFIFLPLLLIVTAIPVVILFKVVSAEQVQTWRIVCSGLSVLAIVPIATLFLRKLIRMTYESKR